MALTIINNLLVVLTLHVYNSSLFKVKDIPKYKIVLGWIIVAFIFSSQALLSKSYYFYNMLSFLLPYLIISLWAYEAGIKRKLFYIFSYYIFALIFDVLLYAFLKNFFSYNEIMNFNDNSWLIFFYNIFIWMIVRCLSVVINQDHIFDIKLADWFDVVFVPVGSMFLVVTCYAYKKDNSIYDCIGLTIILFFNIFSYFTYKKMQERVYLKYRAGLLENQNRGFIEETKRITKMWYVINEFQHDNKFNFSSILEDNNKNKELNIRNCFAVANSGNFVVDSIINYISVIAENENIKMNVDLCIPIDVQYYDDDLSVLICNLLYNSIEAKCSEHHYINISIKCDARNESTLFIIIENPYLRKLRKNYHGEYLTTKEDKIHHGIGMQSIKRIVEKHQGRIKIYDTDNIFRVEIILFDMKEASFD